ncbi:hypothetical protein GE09DRAFT_182916 [Coniochaeta sp. 2T2.1]|nr:hypothetical protein GE09DRAFT_182916 [Coniochaeta sp. 2T2.1]
MQAAKLELPEGYIPKKSPDMGKSKAMKAIAKAAQDKERKAAGLPPLPAAQRQRAPVDKRLNRRLMDNAEDLGLDFDPPAKDQRLSFTTNRKWRSLDNPQEFLKMYAEFQQRKLDPKVFAVEQPGPDNEWEREYIEWFQRGRYHYYKRQERLPTLQALLKVKNWPNFPNITTKAPFVRSASEDHPFAENCHNRALGLFRVLSVHDIGRLIMKMLADDGFMPLSSLSRTCHAGFDVVAKYIEVWDTTPPGDFMGEDVYLGANDGVQRTPATLMVTPIRPDWSYMDGKRADFNFADHYQTETKLLRAIHNRAMLISNLQLHRLQFLDINAVRCIISSLPNLKLLGIYQCQLLHLGSMWQILHTIRQCGLQVLREDTSFVKLDFFPMFHEGPNNILRHGSFGASWNNPGTDSAAAIWQLVLYHLYPKALALGFDILEWGCAFRHFLEKCPMREWAVPRIVEAVKSLEYTGKTHVGRYADGLKMRTYNKSDAKWVRFADDLTAALRGDGLEPVTVDSEYLSSIGYGDQDAVVRKYGWWRDTKSCADCHMRVLAVFCPFAENRCWLCLSHSAFDGGIDHFQTQKASAAELWFKECKYLDDAVKEGASGKGLTAAKQIDRFRRLELTNAHGTNETDWSDHPDIMTLPRRYARYYEPHGGLDRKLNDRQYHPIGMFPSGVTSRLAANALADAIVVRDHGSWDSALATIMSDWESSRQQSSDKRIAREPRWKRANERRKYRKEQIEHYRQVLITKINGEDARRVEARREPFERRLKYPNIPIKCWDETIQDYLHALDVEDINGSIQLLPCWVQEKRPTGRLHAYTVKN